MQLLALLRLAFTSAVALHAFTLLHTITRWPVLQKVRGHLEATLFAPSACKHKVSDSISLPFRGSFHLSLTVLFAIGHWVVFSLRRWSSHTSDRVSRVPPYSGATLKTLHFAYGDFTLFVLPFQTIWLCFILVLVVHNPTASVVWALSISLAATLKIDFSFSSSGYLDVSVLRVTFSMTIYSS